MDWSDERWVKLFTRDTTDWLTLSWQAQGLFCLVLRKVNRAGVIDLGKSGKRGLSSHIGGGSAWREVEPALDELLTDGCVVIDGATLTVPNFVRAQTALQSDKARKRAERERAADVTPRDTASRDVTGCRADVTRGHAASRDVTTRETRGDERDETKELSPAPVAAPPLPAQPTWAPALDLRDEATTKPTPKRPRAAKPYTPPPFSVGDAFAALAAAAGGRFAPGVERDWTQGVRIAAAKLVRQYPDLAAWRTVGEWLAAGGDRYRNTVGPSWASSTALVDAMVRSREWAANGRGPVSAQTSTPDAIDPWAAAAARNGVTL